MLFDVYLNATILLNIKKQYCFFLYVFNNFYLYTVCILSFFITFCPRPSDHNYLGKNNEERIIFRNSGLRYL